MSDSIKVAIKVRPLIKREKDENLPIQWTVQENVITSTDPEMRKRGDGRFQFDHIFDMETNNKVVFNTVVKPIVDAGVNGFNGTVFAYGQTSSGKTYTMMGTSVEPGIIPLTVRYMFDAISATVQREFLLRVSYLEIYNEKINDLLEEKTDLKLHEDSNGQVQVKCKEEVANCSEMVLSLMKKGDKNRRIAETNMNDRSSRSHTIFRITIESREKDDSDGAVQVSQLNLVDLAGSERVRQTGATGERFKEGRSINLSLSTLALVIKQLSESHEGPKYVNFRDSKLTRLLQTSLGGNAMTTIICAITPAALDETQCTLSFASRAKCIKNKPQLNEVMSDAALLKRYAIQLAKLNAELEHLKQENRSAEVEKMECKLQEKDRINQMLEERIELLKTRIVSGNTESRNKSFKQSTRRRTWGGCGTLSNPNFNEIQSRSTLPPIKEMSPDKSRRKSIIQSVDIKNQTFQTAFADFELELLESERDRLEYDADSEEDTSITKRQYNNRVKFVDDVEVIALEYDSFDGSPVKRNISSQTNDVSPDTPKNVLRESVTTLEKDLRDLREFTTLERQLNFENHECCTHENDLQRIPELEKQLATASSEKSEVERELCTLRQQFKEFKEQQLIKDKELKVLERQLQNITNEKNEYEYMSTDLRKRLREIERDKILLEDRESEKDKQLEKMRRLEEEVANFASEKDQFKSIITELRKELEEAKQQKDTLLHNEKEKMMNLEQEFVKLTIEKNDCENICRNLRKELENMEEEKKSMLEREAEKDKELQEVSELKEQLANLLSEKDKFENSVESKQIDKQVEEFEDASPQSFALQEHLNVSIDDSVKTKEDLISIKLSLEEDNARLSTDLELKIQELDEIKTDVRSLKMDIENLQKTILLVTTENKEMSDKLYAVKDHAKKVENELQETINELQVKISKITDEKMNLENDYKIANEQLNSLQSKMSEACNEETERTILEYQSKIETLEKENIELALKITEKSKELESIQENKSLPCDHECIYKENVEKLKEKITMYETENMELSNDLMDRIEENEALKKQYDVLKEKLDAVLKVDSTESDIERLNAENNNLKLEVIELQAKTASLADENSKLLKTMEDENNAKNLSSVADNSLLSSTALNISVSDAHNDSIIEDNDERLTKKATSLEEKVKHLTRLNKKLTDVISSHSKQCDYLKTLHDSGKALKLEVQTLNHKCEDLQKEFDRKCAEVESLKMKTKEDLNLSVGDISLNATIDEMNATYLEETIQTLNNEVRLLKDKYEKLSTSYQEKCNELEELQNNSTCEDTDDSQPKKHKSGSRIEKIHKSIDQLGNEISEIKKHNSKIRSDLNKFMSEKASLQDEINLLKAANAELLQKVSDSELFATTANTKAVILEKEVTELNGKLDKYSLTEKEINEQKLLLEKELENLREEKDRKEKLIEEMHQSISELNRNLSEMKIELDLITQEKEETLKSAESMKNRHQEDIALIEKEKVDLIESRNSIEHKYKDEINSLLKNFEESSRASEMKIKEITDSLNKYIDENESMKQQIEKLQEIERKFYEIQEENKHLQDTITNNNSEKLNEELNVAKKQIVKEMKSLKSNINTQDLLNTSVDQLFLAFLETLLLKEQELMKQMKEQHNKEKRKLEEEKQQSADNEKRTLTWAKELEADIDRLYNDLTKQENRCKELQEKNLQLEHQLKDNTNEKHMLQEKMEALESDYTNLQAELETRTKSEKQDESVSVVQKKEKLAHEALKNKENELQLKIISDKEMYEKKIEELTLSLESCKAENIELKNNIKENKEELEVLEKQLKNIIDVKSGELKKSNETLKKLENEMEQLTEAYNELNREMENKNSKLTEVTALLKTKCDNLSEYKVKFETILPEYELLKEQVKERKATIDRYKTEIETLRIEREQEVQAIKDKLNTEEITCAEVKKQLAELNNKNLSLISELEALKGKCENLERENAKLEKKVRNSTNKSRVEAEIEEFKDLNKTLQNNLEGASNRISELQDSKTRLLQELTNLRGQYDLLLQENAEMKVTLSSYKSKLDSSAIIEEEKYDALLQEKNKIALELEGSKLLLSQKENDLNDYRKQIEELNVKNKELDEEAEQLAQENKILEDKLYTYLADNNPFETETKIKSLTQRNEKLEEALKSQSGLKTNELEDLKRQNEKLQKEIKALNVLKKEHSEMKMKINDLETKLELRSNSSGSRCSSPSLENTRRRHSRNEMFNQRRQLEIIDLPESEIEDNEYKVLREKIRELELELVSKRGKIATLEMQIQSENFPYEKKCKDLEETVLAYHEKNNELKSEIKRLKKAIVDINVRECDRCRRWRENRRNQETQTIPDSKIRFCGTSSGIVEEHIKITKLMKDNEFMKKVCRSRSSRIKELEERIKELEGFTQNSPVLREIESSEENIPQQHSSLPYSSRQFESEKSLRQAMKENVPANLVDGNLSSNHRRRIWNQY